MPFFDSIQKCGAGLFCLSDLKENAVKRCLPPSKVGGPCSSEKECKGRLMCGFIESYKFKSCYDPENSLKQGEECDPDAKAGKRGKECGPSRIEVLDCLPKENRDGFFCQKMAPLYSTCSYRRNIACQPQQTCTRGICMDIKLNAS